MRKLKVFPLCLFLVLFFSPPCLYSQDVPVNRQLLLLMAEILNDLDSSTNSLEASITASNKIINSLLPTNNSMRTTIEMQQRQLNQESENSANWEATALQRSQEYEQTLQSLKTSFTTLSRENKEKDGKILKLTEINAAQTKIIFIMGGILGIITAYLIIRLVLWIKGGTAASLINKFL